MVISASDVTANAHVRWLPPAVGVRHRRLLLAAFGSLLPELVHRSISDADYKVPAKA